MSIATWLLAGLAIGLFVYAWTEHGQQQAVEGLHLGAKSMWQFLPLIVLAFLLSGLLEAMMPQTVIQGWLGVEAGWRGPLIGTVVGFLMPGGPYVILPIIATLYRAGASIGTAVALITSWTLWNVISLAFELSIVGIRFTLIRLSIGFAVPPVAGLLAQLLFGTSQ